MPGLEGDEEVKLDPEETIAERIILHPRKRKYRNRIENFDCKQTIN